MRNKPELLVTAGSLDDVVRLTEAGADAVLIGDRRFGLRLPGSFSLTAIGEAAAEARERQAVVDVSMNGIMSNEQLPLLPDYLRELSGLGVRAVVFGDPAVLTEARAHAPQLRLHWNAEMTATNYATANYWARQGAARAILARELNLDEVLEIQREIRMETEIQVHGITNMYHSKRHLLQSYLTYSGLHMEMKRAEDGSAYLTEAERPGQRYPIYEDAGGTHIMSPDDICMLEDLQELLAAGIDSLRIETLMKPAAYNEIVVRAYRAAIDAYMQNPEGYVCDPKWLEEIQAAQDPARELTFGFFYKEQVY